MIDTRKTLINLHNEFPDLTLDALFKILDCFVEEVYINTYPSIPTYYQTTGVDSNQSITATLNKD